MGLMPYIACTFWLSALVLLAWLVHQNLTAMLPAKVINASLLPGTLIAQVGRVIAELVTGATINDTTLFRNDETGEPGNTPDPKPRIPILGPILIGLLPLVFCLIGLHLTTNLLGSGLVHRLPDGAVGPALPVTAAGWWDLMRAQVSLMEELSGLLAGSNFLDWRLWVFMYLLVCFTVRCAPLPGAMRGSLLAILMLGIASGVLFGLVGAADPRATTAWRVVRLAVGWLELLLLVTLLVRGMVGLYRLIRTNA